MKRQFDESMPTTTSGRSPEPLPNCTADSGSAQSKTAAAKAEGTLPRVRSIHNGKSAAKIKPIQMIQD
jgi:hypothetical protein